MSAGSGSGAAGAVGTATSALCLLLSLTAVAVCLLLGAKTAELQGRLAALEERGAAGHGPLLDALQPRVEQLFREVSEKRHGRPRGREPGTRSTAGGATASGKALRARSAAEFAPCVTGFSSSLKKLPLSYQTFPFLLPFL